VASCGEGGAGPGPTPFVCRNGRLTGSLPVVLQVKNLKVHSRLSSMLSGRHHCVMLWSARSRGVDETPDPPIPPREGPAGRTAAP